MRKRKLLKPMCLNKIRSTFLNFSLIAKVTVIVLLLILLPLSILSAWFYTRVAQNVKIKEEQYRIANLRNVKENVDSVLKDYESTLDSIYLHPEFLSFLENKSGRNDPLMKQEQLRYVLSKIRISREYIGSASLIFPDGTLFNSISGYGRFEEIISAQESEIKSDLEYIREAYQGITWQANAKLRVGRKGAVQFISCKKNLRNIYNLKDLVALLVLNISTHCFDNLSSLRHETDSELLVILDNNNNVIWQTPESRINISAEEKELFKTVRSSEIKRIHEIKDGDSEYCYLYDQSSYSGWIFIKLVPKALAYEQINLFNSYLFIVLMFIFFFAAFCIVLINSQLIKPIQRMIVTMDHIDELDKIGVSINTLRNDEIGGLYRAFDQMNSRVDSLIRELKEAYTSDKEKEIKLIQSQLNPHFIYNTLECISCVAYEKNLPEISRALNSLSSILRYSIKHSGEYVTFREELDQLKQYILIQHFRFEDSFEVFYDIDESLLECKTIKFIFQPFVENALLYAFNEATSGCRIDISLKQDDDDIKIQIQDNGVGISEDKINEIMNYDSRGLGIKSIDKALRLQFGNEYHLTIHSKKGKGTTVEIRVPRIV